MGCYLWGSKGSPQTPNYIALAIYLVDNPKTLSLKVPSTLGIGQIELKLEMSWKKCVYWPHFIVPRMAVLTKKSPTVLPVYASHSW